MSSPDQSGTPPLTRRQLRDLRNTGSTPVVDEATAEAVETPDVATPAAAPVAAVPLARPAEPVDLRPAPGPAASVDLGVSPLTRRQAREQERIRTASIPVVSPEPASPAVVSDASPVPVFAADASATPVEVAEESLSAVLVEEVPIAPPREESQVTVNPSLGEGLFDKLRSASVPSASFDDLLIAGGESSGSTSTSNALIVNQNPLLTGSLVAPITGTGEVLITGTFELPEGFGSRGHVEGAADGHEVDAVLIDGELPAASSPTPISASAAISTVKNGSGEIIRPPAPEKGNRLLLVLSITAGALALALVVALVAAFATGALS